MTWVPWTGATSVHIVYRTSRRDEQSGEDGRAEVADVQGAELAVESEAE